MKRDCQKFMEWGNGNPEKYAEWNEKNPIKMYENNRHKGNSQQTGNNNRRNDNISCYHCRKSGHVARECRKLRKEGNQGKGRMGEKYVRIGASTSKGELMVSSPGFLLENSNN